MPMTRIRTRDLLALLHGFPAIIAVTDEKSIILAFDYLRGLTAELTTCDGARDHLGWSFAMQGIKPALQDLFPTLATEQLPDYDYWHNGEVVDDYREHGSIPQHRLETLRQWVHDLEARYGETMLMRAEAS